MAYLIFAVLAGLAVWAAIRGVRRQIAAEQQSEDFGDPTRPWRGAEVYGDGFKGGRPPPESVVRRDWVEIYVPTETELSRGHGFPPESTFHTRDLKAFCDWCQANCKGPWLAVVPAGHQPTFWFENADDGRNFATVWFPFKCT